MLDIAGYESIALCAEVSLLFLVAAVLIEAVRRPTLAEAARLADSLMDDQQRSITALELLAAGESGPVAGAQLASTWRMLAQLSPRASSPGARPLSGGPLLLAGLGMVLCALALFMLKSAGQPFAPVQPGTLPSDAGGVLALASPTRALSLPDAEGTATQQAQARPQGTSTLATASQQEQAAEAGSPTAGVDAAQASSQAQAGLQRLSSALGEQSASQQAADSLRQGSYDQAARQLSELGSQSDQLSDAAKQGLGDALQKAAQDSSSNQALHDAEQAAADALHNGDYKAGSDSLKELGNAVQQTASSVLSQQDLARSFPQPTAVPTAGPQQNPTNQAAAQTQSGQNQSSGQQNQQGQNGQNGQQSQQGQQAQSGKQNGQGGQGSPAGQDGQSQQDTSAPQGQGTDGSQGQGPANNQNSANSQSNHDPSQQEAPGTGHSESGPVDPSRPNAVANPFELDGKAQPGNTHAAPDTNHPALTLGTGAGSGSVTSPSTGSASTVPGENNSLPVERRQVVEKYFQP